MIDKKPEITWDKICQQVDKKRIDRTPRDIFGQPLESPSSTKNEDKDKSNVD